MGMLLEKKIPQIFPMETIEKKLLNPGELVLTDLINFGNEFQQHIAFYSLIDYIEIKKNSLFGMYTIIYFYS